MTVLEKLGTIAIGYALLCSNADEGYLTDVVSHGTMLVGAILLLGGELIERYLREQFPDVDW
jgi:hypothetical protein